MHMGERKLLVPDAVETVDFYGDPLIIALVAGKAYVALRPVANFLGLEWTGQYQRTMRDEVLSLYMATIAMIAADGKRHKMTALQLEYLPGWLFGITPSRVKPGLAPKLRCYREHCFRILWSAFQASLSEVALFPPSYGYRVGVSAEEAKSQARAAYAYYQHMAELVRAHCLRARDGGLLATLTVEQWLCTLEFFGGYCAYCQQKPGVVLEHFVPISLGGGTTVDNCVPSCYLCNTRKGNKHPDDVELIPEGVLEEVRSYLAAQRSGCGERDDSIQPLL